MENESNWLEVFELTVISNNQQIFSSIRDNIDRIGGEKFNLSTEIKIGSPIEVKDANLNRKHYLIEDIIIHTDAISLRQGYKKYFKVHLMVKPE